MNGVYIKLTNLSSPWLSGTKLSHVHVRTLHQFVFSCAKESKPLCTCKISCHWQSACFHLVDNKTKSWLSQWTLTDSTAQERNTAALSLVRHSGLGHIKPRCRTVLSPWTNWSYKKKKTTTTTTNCRMYEKDHYLQLEVTSIPSISVTIHVHYIIHIIARRTTVRTSIIQRLLCDVDRWSSDCSVTSIDHRAIAWWRWSPASMWTRGAGIERMWWRHHATYRSVRVYIPSTHARVFDVVRS